MKTTGKQLVLLAAAFALFSSGIFAAGHQPGSALAHINQLPAIIDSEGLDTPELGHKHPFIIKGGDCELIIGGRAKIEHYLQDNMYLLNKNIPDENQYFKETVDMTFDVIYGKKKYGYKAAEFFVDIRHKGVWGKALGYADKDAGTGGPSYVRFNSKDQALFGNHQHTSGKPLLWFKDAWLSFSPNAGIGTSDSYLHFLKLGWFPFEMGRGIAFGAVYGLNKQLLGLYTYPEDKGAPGINLNGTIIKDRLSYDIYYARFEERGKALSDTLDFTRLNIVGRSATPWRGIAKDDEAIAARIKWKPFDDHKGSKLELEPYIFYNAASDQTVEITPDAKTNWGSYGLAFEGSYGDFEYGAETAFNYGKSHLFNIDRNLANVTIDATGSVIEQYGYILVGSPTGPKAQLSKEAKAAAGLPVSQADGAQIIDKNGNPTGFFNAPGRFRPAYVNKFDGWMAVVDAAYTIEKANVKLAAAYGYASGDVNPNDIEADKTYHGFIGLHEIYSGKRVKSIIILDERLLKRPVIQDPITTNDINSPSYNPGAVVTADADMTFSDLQHVGFGATWTPKTCIKDLSVNPNLLAFWSTHTSNKFNQATQTLTSEIASTFLGTELNILTRCSIVKDLTLFVNWAVFLPGQFFADERGIQVGSDLFQNVVDDQRNDVDDPTIYRLNNDTAFHLNMGLEFKF